MQLFTEKHAEGRVIVYPDGETLGEGLPHRRGAVYFKSPKQAAEHLEKMNKAGAILEAAGYSEESAAAILQSTLKGPRHQVAQAAAYWLQKNEKSEPAQKLAAAILAAHPGGAVSMDREELEKEALFTVSATNFYDLGDNIENTTDEELERIIAAGGDESKEGAA